MRLQFYGTREICQKLMKILLDSENDLSVRYTHQTNINLKLQRSNSKKKAGRKESDINNEKFVYKMNELSLLLIQFCKT